MEKKITKVEVQKNNKERVNIYIGGEFQLSCSAELAYRFNLKSGKAVELEELTEIIEEDNYIKCKNSALKYIERSYKSEKEITDKLLEKGYEEKTVERTMEFLKTYGFLDDSKYVQLYVKEKIKSQGKNKIKHSLARKGFNESIISEALKGVDSSAEENTALILAEKKLKILVKSEGDKRKIYRKLGEFLIRNGFSAQNVKETVERVMRDFSFDVEEVDSYSESKSQDHRKLRVKNSKAECGYEEGLCSGSDIREEDGHSDTVSASASSTREDPMETLLRLAEKRYEILRKSEDNKTKLYKKLCDYCMRRGYGFEDIKRVLRDIIHEV